MLTLIFFLKTWLNVVCSTHVEHAIDGMPGPTPETEVGNLEASKKNLLAELDAAELKASKFQDEVSRGCFSCEGTDDSVSKCAGIRALRSRRSGWANLIIIEVISRLVPMKSESIFEKSVTVRNWKYYLLSWGFQGRDTFLKERIFAIQFLNQSTSVMTFLLKP